MNFYSCKQESSAEYELRVILVPWSVGLDCWFISVFYHWKWTTLELYLFAVTWLVNQTSVVYSVNDIPSVLMVKGTEGPKVWSDIPWKEYDTGYWGRGHTYSVVHQTKLLIRLPLKLAGYHQINRPYWSNRPPQLPVTRMPPWWSVFNG